MTNIFEVRVEAKMNQQVVEAVQAIRTIYGSLGLFQLDKEFEEMGFTIYEDQDRGRHLVMKSDYLNEEQLDDVYNYTFLAGSTCADRSVLYWKKPEAKMQVKVKGVVCEVSPVTVASVLQKSMFGPKDMQLMSNVLKWLHADLF